VTVSQQFPFETVVVAMDFRQRYSARDDDYQRQTQVEAITEEWNSLATGRSFDTISNAYSRDYEQAQRVKNTYRLCLYPCSVILLA
jgi:hypothetical protein